MANRILQERIACVSEMAATLGATVTASDERNVWNVAVAGEHAGQIRYEPRAHLWLATTGTESTVGDLAGWLQFVIRHC